ncbi:MAG: methyltransferase domain-containing protein [Eubacteriales bacterium]|nr:methyltransferase domain-containing protein [Eubacteriales bacterium]
MPQLQNWDYLLKQLLWRQLSFLRGAHILDFGSGDGATADHFAGDNHVTAVELSREQLVERFCEHDYMQLAGSLDQLAAMPDGCFDAVLCHNVLEYIDDKQAVLSELSRVLRKGGLLSVVKHNRAGRVFQMAVLLDDFDRAHTLLDGQNSVASRFGEIRYYEDEDLLRMCPGFRCETVFGARAFWDLQQNQTLHADDEWRRKMLALEERVSTLEPYRSAAFFHHLLLRKQ